MQFLYFTAILALPALISAIPSTDHSALTPEECNTNCMAVQPCKENSPPCYCEYENAFACAAICELPPPEMNPSCKPEGTDETNEVSSDRVEARDVNKCVDDCVSGMTCPDPTFYGCECKNDFLQYCSGKCEVELKEGDLENCNTGA